MTFYLLGRGGDALLATDRPIVKAGERNALDSAADLLARLREDAARASEANAAAEREARDRGYRDGEESGRRDFIAAIAELAAQAAQHREAEEAEIASLAIAALRKMVDSIGDEAMLAGIARRAVAAVAPGGAVLVEAAPAACPAIEEALGGFDHAAGVTVRPDPALSERQCRITAPDGRIIADLDVQLDALAGRLEGAHVD